MSEIMTVPDENMTDQERAIENARTKLADAEAKAAEDQLNNQRTIDRLSRELDDLEQYREVVPETQEQSPDKVVELQTAQQPESQEFDQAA